ncbi:response regulator transcription factor [Priestia flexa]|uniref:response regulator transcription factor n=1 Tax=Priestia flexa TaxID=86664 RepID=UPI001B325428|nr:response regulator [Priestia flexa]
MHILLVDDEPLELEQLEYIINENFSYWNIHKAADASQAMKILKYYPVNLVLLDIQLPGKSGIELGREIKTQYKLDIIMVTAFQSFDYAKDSLRLGAKDYITKPIIEEELIKVLNPYRYSTIQSHIIHQTLAIIHNQYATKLSLSNVAQQIHVNSTYLSRKFHDEMNIGFSEYLNNFRIKQAEILLIQDDEKSILCIAEECGFSSQHYFSSLFKKQLGCTPTEYRAKLKVKMQ